MDKTHVCPTCKTKMILVELLTSNSDFSSLIVRLKAKTFWQKFNNPTKTKVICYCCGDCGKLEMFAENPEKIKYG